MGLSHNHMLGHENKMNKDDKAELNRLCDVLKKIDAQCVSSPENHEAVAKAALALHHVFIHGSRSEIESQFDNRGKPLSSEQKAHLRDMGIETVG